jgi:starvation-inducible outer membrane lipoprotein
MTNGDSIHGPELPFAESSVSLVMKIKYLLPVTALLLTGCVTRSTTVSAPPPGPSITQVQAMVQAHVSDSVIVNQIQSSSSRYTLTADQIITLKNAGVSDAVLNALITSVNKPSAQTTTTIVEQTPVVYPYVYMDPWPLWGWGPGYYRGGYYRGYHHWH